MSKQIKIGFMGATWPCRSHAEGFQGIKGVEFQAVSELDVGKRKAFVENFGAMAEYDDYRKMIKEEDLDAVVVGLPTGLHYQATTASLNQGLHVMCEKPPATSVKDMKAIANLAKKKKLTYMFCRQPRFTAESLASRKLVASGKLGDIYHAETKWIRCRGIPWGVGGWFVNKAKGGGVLLDLGIHAIDNAWFVMGCPKPVEVMGGMHCAFSHLAPKGIEYTAEDCALGLVRFENGATLDFMVTFALNTAGQNAVDAKGPTKTEWGEVKLYGAKGGVDVRAGKKIIGRKKDVMVSLLSVPKNPQPVFKLQGRDFIDAIRTGREPTNSAAQAVMLMQMLEGLRKSGENNRAVRIN